MPLPSALAAKLAKRGILASKKSSEQNKKANYKGWSACPNKSNIFHECTCWCETHWKGVQTPEPRYVRNMQKLLFKYPLPNNWTEVFDKGLGRYYYWNMENDLVSWLPPRHPQSTKSFSAAKLREKRLLGESDTHKSDQQDSDKEDKESDDEDKGYNRRDRDRESRDDRRHRREDSSRHSRAKKRREDITPAIDPMDPASYSDIPQGTWSDGLENNKSRADSTASGVLYQQRPYPAPGDVLASNKEKTKKK